MYESVPGVGTDLPDIVFRVTGIQPAICLEINKRIGINDHIYNAANIDANSYYQGSLSGPIPASTATLTGIPISAAQAGTFCFCIYADKNSCETSSPYRPTVAHVLVAR